jgi:hypothetical protein
LATIPDELLVPTVKASFKPLITSSFVKLGAAVPVPVFVPKMFSVVLITLAAVVFVLAASIMVVELVKAVDPTEHVIERDAHAMFAQHVQKAIARKGSTFVVNVEQDHIIDIYI